MIEFGVIVATPRRSGKSAEIPARLSHAQFTVEHALSCSRGGFSSHNEQRDITADMLCEVCHNDVVEPALQPLTEEQLSHRRANRDGGAHLDIAAEATVFNLFAQSHKNIPLAQCYQRNDLEKRRAYGQWNREVEHSLPWYSQQLEAWEQLLA